MTIQAIVDILVEFSEKIKYCKAETKEEYLKSINDFIAETLKKFMELRRVAPELVQMNYDDLLFDNEIDMMIASLRENNSKRTEMAPILYDSEFEDVIQGKRFRTPDLSYLPAISFVGKNWQKMLVSILAASPIRLSHFTFIDMNMTGEGTIVELNKKLCTNIYNQDDLHNYTKKLKKRVEDFLQKGTVPDTYEFIFVLSGSHLATYFSSIFSKGIDSKIYFLIANDTGDEWPNCERRDKFEIRNRSYKDALTTVTPLCNNPKLCEAILKYANDEMEKNQSKKEENVISSDYLALCQRNYVESINSISVPIGISENEPHYFCLDTVGHVHSFIIGQSGTGKSTLLHNIILGATATYSPESLLLYLVDLKIGGVEFNRYRNIKHVRALLIDNSDIQITVEVLRDLQKLMSKRGKLLRDSDSVGIEDYNKKNPTHKLPQVLFIADECQELFNAHGNKNSALFREMSSIIEKIAKEGRSQGVHLVLATQTLADAEISNSIINNITDYYLFKCSIADSEKLVRDSSKQTSTMTTGMLLYTGMEKREIVNSYYSSNEKMKDVLTAVEAKAMPYNDNRVCFFSGTQLFKFNTSDCYISKTLHKNSPLVSLGYSISLDHEAIRFPLADKDGENLLLVGINDEQQVTRTALVALTSMLISILKMNLSHTIYIIDLLRIEESRFANLYKQFETNNHVVLVNSSQQGEVISKLADNIIKGDKTEAILVILGQERFSALKLNKELNTSHTEDNKCFDSKSFSFKSSDNIFSKSTVKSPSTYKEALELILVYGPSKGIHTILQVDTPEKLLFNDYISPKMVASMFNHLVLLRSRDNVAPKLGLDDEVRLERLSSSPERLRAYYYNLENNTYKLFTPYSEIENYKLIK